jgi:hypothetical protein
MRKAKPNSLVRSETRRGRFYDSEGKKYPSVTTILSCLSKPALIRWSANVEREMVMEAAADYHFADEPKPETRLAWMLQFNERLGQKRANQKLLEKAGEIGTQAHQMIEWTLRMELCQTVGPSPEIGPEAKLAYAAWVRWRDTVKFKPILIESQVVSHKYQYAGTMDYLCAEVNGIETLCDWKTGKRVYYEAHLQNAAYRQAVREMGVADPKAGLILRLPKTKEDPTFEAVPARCEAECFALFLAAKQLWIDMDKEDKWEPQAKEAEKTAAPGPPKASIPDWQPVSDS